MLPAAIRHGELEHIGTKGLTLYSFGVSTGSPVKARLKLCNTCSG